VETSTPKSSVGLSEATNSESPASSIMNEDMSPKLNIQRRVRMSSAQSRFWFLNEFLADKTASNVTFSYNVQGRLHATDLSKAVKTVAQAHEALRTCFVTEEHSCQTVLQGLLEISPLELETYNSATDKEIESAYLRVRNTVYDLEKGSTMQIILLSKDTTSHTIIFGYHHIVMDGVGFEAFLLDLERAYPKRRVSPQSLQYFEFSEREGAPTKTDNREQKLLYWRQEFKETPGTLPLLPVSKVKSRRVVSRCGSSYVQRRLGATMAAKLKAICQKYHATPSHFYLATFRVMLMRFAEVRDICIGLADANRHDSNVMSTVGLFLNILPVSFRKSTSSPFGDVLKETRTKVYKALGHAGIPFDDLLQGKKK
jgi:hybrid polyketide synthase/nonribosomal peptide synthetase ACE1